MLSFWISIPMDDGMKIKVSKKITKCLDYARQLKKKQKTTVHAGNCNTICTSALETVHKWLENGF